MPVVVAGRVESEYVHVILAGVESAVAGADSARVVVFFADFVLEAAAGEVGVEAFVGFDFRGHGGVGY